MTSRPPIERVLIVADGPWFLEKTAMCLRQAGLRVATIGTWRVPASLSSRVERYVRLPTSRFRHDSAALLDAINEMLDSWGPAVVMGGDMIGTSRLAELADQLEGRTVFPVVEAERLHAVHDKSSLAEILTSLNLPRPDHHGVFRTIEEIDEVADSLPYPVMVKPLEGSDCIGVERVDTAQQLREHVRSNKPGFTPPVLVQDFVPGHDIDMSLLADHGSITAWTIQTRTESNPHVIDLVHEERILDSVSELIEKTDFHGIAHIDLRHDDRTGHPVIIELNPRVYGSIQYSAWAGVNLPYLGALLAQGIDPAPLFEPVEATVRAPMPTPAGWLRRRLRLHPKSEERHNLRAWRDNHDNLLVTLATRVESRLAAGKSTSSDNSE